MAFKKNVGRGSRLWLPFFMVFFGLAGALAQDGGVPSANPVKVDEEGRLLIDVDVGGRGTYPFLLDTGADRTVVYRTLTVLAELEAVPLRSERVRTATGTREMQLYQLDYVEALGMRLPIGETVVFPDPRTRERYGILGVDLMRGRTLQVLGAEAKLLEEAPSYEGEGWYTIAGRPVGRGSLAVMVRIGDLEVPAFVDTGAARTIINQPALFALEDAYGEELKGGYTTVAAAGGRMVARRLTAPQLSIGDWQLAQQDLVAAQLPVFTFWGARQVPAMILGADILFSASGVAMDFDRWRLMVKPRN